MSRMPQERVDLPGQHGAGMAQDEPQIHVSGIFIVLLEVALVLENSLPILVVISWLPSCARGVGDRLIAALSVTCILSALIPTPLGLASYFSGSWYGGSPTCNTYQVTSIWCNLSALALLCYICINCHCAVSRLLGFRIEDHSPGDCNQQQQKLLCSSLNSDANSLIQQYHSNSKQETSDEILDSYIDDFTQTNYTPLQANGTKRNCSSEFHQNYDPNVTSQVTEDSQSSEREISNTFQPDLDGQTNTPGVDDSLFESSKLEFLAENVQSINAALRSNNSNNIVYESIRERPRETNDELLYSDLKISCEGDITQHHLQNSTSVSLQHQNPDSGVQNPDCYQDDTSSIYYDSLPQNNTPTTLCSHTTHSHSELPLSNTLFYENSTFLYTNSLLKNSNTSSASSHSTQQHTSTTAQPPSSRLFQARDYVSLILFFLCSVTLTISSLPVVGFGPQHDKIEKLCSSWLVPTPHPQRERVFFIAFLTCVYVCMVLGCATAARVAFLVNRRIKQEMRRTTRLYHQENIPDIREFSIIDDLKRHYSLTCLAVCGILTWLPIAIMLTLQKSGVQVSEATLVYSNIATSLPCLLNPLLYSLVLARYREGYKAILERCCRKKNLQKSHQMKNVRNCRGADAMDIDIVTTPGGHRCVHGHPNPTFESYTGFDIDEDIFEDDEENIEDEEDLDQYYQLEQDEEAKNTLNVKLSEKTPLQTTSLTSKNGKSPVGLANKRHWPFPPSQSNDDEVCLITNEIAVCENETGV